MEPVKIIGEWRRGGELEPGLYMRRSDASFISLRFAKVRNGGRPDYEYIGPIEIVEAEPELTPMPGCYCDDYVIAIGRHYARSINKNSNIVLSTSGTTKREAILRHNAAVAAIVAMEGEVMKTDAP